jgi:hypothetical protein
MFPSLKLEIRIKALVELPTVVCANTIVVGLMANC